MVYVCGNCRFSFERSGAVSSCPDCASNNICEATDAEVKEFYKIKSELESEGKGHA